MILTTYTDPVTGRGMLCITAPEPVEHITQEMLDEVQTTTNRYAKLGGEQDDVITFTDDFGHRYTYRLAEFDVARNAYAMHRVET